MARLTNERIDGIVAAYRDDPSATIDSIAEAEGLTTGTIRSHLDAANVPIRSEGFASDDDLGIGDVPITETAAFKDAVAKAVAEAVAQALASPKASDGSLDYREFMKKMESLTESVNTQTPGYQKPLNATEFAHRQEGKAEFFALIAKAREAVRLEGKPRAIQAGLVPEYIVGEGGYYGNTVNGETQFLSGQRIFLTTAPPEDFLPMNNAAGAIMRAQMQWLGEPTPEIHELVAQAMMRANGSEATYLMGGENPIHADDAELVDAEADLIDMRPKRTLGSSAPEMRAPSLGGRAPAQGPIFAN